MERKASEKRNAVLSILKGTRKHPTAEWIYRHMQEQYPNIGLATVYRNLKILREQGEVMKIDVGDGLDHYDANIHQAHDHTFCIKCGAIGDIKSIPAGELGHFAEENFSVQSYSLILYGKCKKCMQEETLEK